MARYMVQVSYTPRGWAALVNHPQNRMEVLQPVLERLGGRMEGVWFSFGDYDVVALLELPDNISAGAFSAAASAGGAVSAVKTTALLSVEEGMKMLVMAGESGYKPPK